VAQKRFSNHWFMAFGLVFPEFRGEMINKVALGISRDFNAVDMRDRQERQLDLFRQRWFEAATGKFIGVASVARGP
jgi:hypothetical protein